MRKQFKRTGLFLLFFVLVSGIFSAAYTVLAAPDTQTAAASPIIVGPMLESSIADDSAGTSSIWVIWETAIDAAATAEVRYGLSADALDMTATGSSIEFGEGTSNLHEVQLTDLQPFTVYYYQVRFGTGDADFSPVVNFISAPLGNSEQGFTMIGTSDEQPGELNPTYDRIVFRLINENLVVPEVCGTVENCAEALQVLLSAGDNADAGNYDEYAPWFAARQVLQERVQTIGTPGNHDYDSQGTAVNYYAYHHYPENASLTTFGLSEDPEFDPSYNEHWFYQDYSNVRFVSLDSNIMFGEPNQGPTALQLRWLEALLDVTCTAENIDFVILMMHHNSELDEIWSVGYNPNTGELVDKVEQFATDCGRPTFYIYGHAHDYNRGHDSEHNHTFMNIAVGGGTIDAWPKFSFSQDFEEVIASDASFGYARFDVTAGETPSIRIRRYSAGYTPNAATASQGVIDDFTITRSDNNPDTPEAVEAVVPESGATNAVVLRGSAYSDPDNVPMMTSRWQVTTVSGDYSAPVFDHLESYRNWYRGVEMQDGDDITETEFRNFQSDTDYFWRVRYRNQNGHWGEWSQEAAFTVGDVQPFFLTDASTYRPGQGVEVIWSGLPGNAQDWVSIAEAGSPENTWVGDSYYYTGGVIGGSHTFYGLPVGQYEARVYHDWPNGGYTVQASYPFTVEGDIAVTLVTDKDTYLPGEIIDIDWENMPGNLNDFIIVAPQGAAGTRQSDGLSMGTNGAYNGHFHAIAPEAGGTYEVRAYVEGAADPVAVKTITIQGSAPTDVPAAAAEGECLLVEDFEGLPLNPASGEQIDPSVLGWSQTPPEGWTITNRDGMAAGMPEWQGWSFATMNFWNSADQQDRVNFTRSSGIFAVADPDEWDDLNSPSAAGTYDSFLSTPALDITGVGTVALTFDSHYRQEAPQVALVTASFDGGETVEVLRYDQNNADDVAQQNQAIALEIPVPAGAQTLVITWALVEAGNNWFWAVDNIRVSADVALDRETLCDVPHREVTPIPTPAPVTATATPTPTMVPTEAAAPVDPSTILFQEDFNDFTLKAAVDEEVGPILGWNTDSQGGWTITVPESVPQGTTEWQGWSATTMDFWNAADPQDRILFTRSSGVFMVADPDEWDDNNIGTSQGGIYETSLTSPAIDLAGAGKVQISFDSHYWQEDTQEVSLTAVFDTGESTELLYYGPSNADDEKNLHLSFEVFAPAGASSVQFVFRMFNATNDWYWAIDNVLVVSVPAVVALPYRENFDGLMTSLQPAVDEAEIDPALVGWTHTAPSGWTVMTPDTVPQGTTEWQGWSFTTREFWAAADTQERENFSKASGVLAVADPDEWDDFNAGTTDEMDYNTFLTTPALDVAGLSTAYVSFDSHWRPEDKQVGTLTATFDSGESVEVLRFDSTTTTDDGSHLDETVELPVSVPSGASTMTLTWAVIEAGNDWFWAIDNVAVLNAPPVVTVALPYRQDFDSLASALQAAVDEAEIDPTLIGWTHTTPEGWSIITPDTVPQGAAEWQGWSFTTLEFWTAADQQEREAFTKAFGVLAVADPDEWDDFNAGTTDEMDYSTFLNSPAFAVTNVPSVFVTFDSHWRPEDKQVGVLTATFDTGESVELLRYDSTTTVDDGSNLNETVDVSVSVPQGATSMTLTWSVIEAGNDWFWAIDNLRVIAG